MKRVIFVALIALVQAKIDWSKIERPRSTRLPNPEVSWPVDNTNRIVGGQEAVPNSIPYQVALLTAVTENNQDVTSFCGGSLISCTYVMTAAHCKVPKATFKGVTVIIGAHNVRVAESGIVVILSTNFKIHEQYDAAAIRNDIAVIKLPIPVQLNGKIGIVKLPSRSDAGNRFVGALAKVSGWGLTSDSATTISPTLNYVEGKIISKNICSVPFLGGVANSNICMTGLGGKGSCNGDSGGPMVINGIQAGIVSFGSASGCQNNFPTVYTRTTSYLDWIENNTDVVIST